MKFEETNLKTNYLVKLETKEDKRGIFGRFYCEKEFSEQGLNTRWVQINISTNKKIGTFRGLHYQRQPNTEVKLVRCLKGAIWDVVVDLRYKSATYGKWFGEKLSNENRTMMYVPKGFAHGFISLEPNTEILYLVSEFYTPDLEGALIWNDLGIGINWPIEPLVISDKDKSANSFENTKPLIL